jgi:hypothetical protein
MNPIYVPLLSALAGALIGSAASIITVIVQAKIGRSHGQHRPVPQDDAADCGVVAYVRDTLKAADAKLIEPE